MDKEREGETNGLKYSQMVLRTNITAADFYRIERAFACSNFDYIGSAREVLGRTFTTQGLALYALGYARVMSLGKGLYEIETALGGLGQNRQGFTLDGEGNSTALLQNIRERFAGAVKSLEETEAVIREIYPKRATVLLLEVRGTVDASFRRRAVEN
ncbi:MAG: hypothetical protein WC686_04550 [Candidatus Shapirobacteria bacterium]|jgi:hypothetical protein